MNNGRMDFSSRLSARAIVAGTILVFAQMILFLSIVGAFGLWRYDFTNMSQLGLGFYFLAYTAWIVSLFVGGCVAAFVSRSASPLDGALHGLVLWASACVSGCLFLAMMTGSVFGGFLSGETTTGTLWGVFLVNVVALSASIIGGYAGSRAEAKAESTEEKPRVAA